MKLIPRQPVADLIEREIAKRGGDAGQLCAEIAASGKMTLAAAQRRIYTIRTGTARRKDGTSYVQQSVDADVVDKIVQALDLTHLYAELEPPAAISDPLPDEPTPKRKRKTGVPRKLTDAQVRAAHVLYTQQRLSFNKLGELLWRKHGYGSARACGATLCEAFKALGLPARDRIEATRMASTKNGLSPRDHRLRSKRRRAAGLTYQGMKPLQPRCAAKNRRGKPCPRQAMFGSTLCWSHDPARAEERAKQAAEMRARKPLPTMDPDKLTTAAEVLGPLREFVARYERQYEAFDALAAQLGRKSRSSFQHVFAYRDDQPMTKTFVAEILGAIEQLTSEQIAA